MALLTKRCAEWNQELWVGLVDFEKAFDTVEHSALWKVLRSLGVGENYISLLRRLYNDQTASVVTGTTSRIFQISKG